MTLTREQILNMEAGQELDALVAQRVMGWETLSRRFSTDIAAAWEVVEMMRADEWHFVIECNTTPEVVVKVYRAFEEPHYSGNWIKSAPLAICRAALLAMLEAVA